MIDETPTLSHNMTAQQGSKTFKVTETKLDKDGNIIKEFSYNETTYIDPKSWEYFG